jgi:DNA-binding beta-propeller fold protein YncE
VVVTPDGSTAYVSVDNDTVVPITTATNARERDRGGKLPPADGGLARWDGAGRGEQRHDPVSPVDTASESAGTSIPVGHNPQAIAIS